MSEFLDATESLIWWLVGIIAFVGIILWAER